MITKKSTVKTSTKTTTKSKQVANKTIDKKTSAKKQTKQEKPKFDVYDPCFKTKMSYIYKWLEYMDETYNDPNDDWLEWDEYMVWAVWLRDEQFYRVNKIPWTLLSAHERTIMGIYDPTSKKSLDDNDRP